MKFDEIFKESKRKPLNLMIDKGNEFINKSLKKFFFTTWYKNIHT